MAIGTAAAVGGAILGGIMGGQKKGGTSSSQQGMDIAPETALETQATGLLGRNLGEFGSLVGAGANQQDVAAGAASQRSLADLLQSYSQGGFLPTAADTAQAGTLADQLLNPSFRQQEVQASRLAARLGRPVNDPIFQNKLRQNLADTRGSFIAQQAMQLPQQRLQYATDLSNVRQGLASQAFSNRQALMSMGSSLREQDRNYRMGTATKWSNQQQESGGGLGGMIGGALAGAGGGLNFANNLASFNRNQQQEGSFGGVGGFQAPQGINPFSQQNTGYNLGGMDTSFSPQASFGGFQQAPIGTSSMKPMRTPAIQQFRQAPISAPQSSGFGGNNIYLGAQGNAGSGGRVPQYLASPELYQQSGINQQQQPQQFNIYGNGY